MYRIDKTTLLLIMATWHFDVIKNYLTLIAFKLRKHRKCEHFLKITAYSKCLLPAFKYSLNLFLNSGLLLSAENFSCFSPVLWLLIKVSKGFVHRSPDMISTGGSNLELQAIKHFICPHPQKNHNITFQC